MRKKIVVTGASGYLGGKLCRALVREGHSVRVLVRPTTDLSFVPHGASVELVFGDVTNYASLLLAFSECHVAALVEPWLLDPSKFFHVNVQGLNNVLRAVRETETVEKLVYSSSIFAFGPTDGFVADETWAHDERFFCTEYERSMVEADKIATRAAAEGLPLVMVYPGFIFGPGKITAGNVIARLLVERFNGRLPGYIGDGINKYTFSHVDDVAQGHIAAMIKGRDGERYPLTGDNASLKRLFDLAADITGTSRPQFNIPLWLVEAYGWASVLLSRITRTLPFFSPPMASVLRHEWAYSSEKAKAEIDYSPRSLKDGLEEILPWLKSLGLINY